jgi:NAD(P)H-dependent flavin oxidoreductase YrpB (nitropropane dioxygenase family)
LFFLDLFLNLLFFLSGIPMKIPGFLDDLAESNDIVQQIDTVEHDDDVVLKFSPRDFWEESGRPDLAIARSRPKFLPIVSSVVLAQSLLKRATGKGPTNGVDGFVIELNTAGGHNAPPRGFKYDAVTKTHSADLNDRGEPIYGEKDEVDLDKFAKAAKGLPFWLAGSYADPQRLVDVLKAGGAGVQVGTAFALSKESGMNEHSRQSILSTLADGKDVDIFTDPEASPTGFPFKVLGLEGTLSDPEAYQNRPRVCSLGYLRDIYKKPDGKLGYRCASEPVDDYVKKGGREEATQGRKCLCNALCADCGFPQVQRKPFEYVEQPLVTMGDDVNNCKRFLKSDENGQWYYSARDVVNFLVRDLDSPNIVANQGNITTMLSP